MTEWYNTFDAVFFTGIATMVFGCFAIIIKTALASKCDNLNLCFGCITVHRKVELESPIEKNEGRETAERTQKEDRKSHDDERQKVV